MKSNNIRAVAATILANLDSGRGSLGSHLAALKIKAKASNSDFAEAALLQEILYGCCRRFHLLEYITNQLVGKPLKRKDNDLKCLLIVGLYQLRHLSTPEYAVLNETVSAASALGKSWGKALVNAVLRSYLRERELLEARIVQLSGPLANSHPEWLFDTIQEQWPAHSTEIISANNSRPPLCLRVNLSRTSRTEVLSEFEKLNIQAFPGKLAPSAVYLELAVPVTTLPGFSSGLLSVQDEASQLVPGLLQLRPRIRVLDACAAPGGKSCHILESEPSLTSFNAIDIDAERLNKVSENLNRLGLNANLTVADAASVSKWWDNKSFDRILLDAPCSATGVIRRHPDIKLLRTRSNIDKLLLTQSALLLSLWKCLASGGLLLYTSCSILREENEENIEQFLEETPDAKYESIAADWGVECRYGRQLLPISGFAPDGFYFALLRKM